MDKCAEQLFHDIEYVKSLMYQEGKSWDDLYISFNSFSFDRQQQPTKGGDKASYDILKELRKDAKEKINKLKTEFFTCSTKITKEDLDTLHPLIKYLCHLVMEFNKLYSNMKKEKGLIDFNDLEHFSLKILTDRDSSDAIIPSSVALSLRDKYEEIMIDEYQDSNMVQEVILNIISKRQVDLPNMFMVGDVKQSIYRFRQAKPELFLDKYSRYSDISGTKDRKIMLLKNLEQKKYIWVHCFLEVMTKYQENRL